MFVKIKNKTFSKVLQSDKSNNDLLMKQILVFFVENNIDFKAISNIFVNQGPGSFSGIRGSLATAKGISISNNLNLIGYNTFIWSCARFIDKKESIYSLIKYRDKYFIKKFDKKLRATIEIKEVSLKEIIKNYSEEFKVIPKNMKKDFDQKLLKLNNLAIVDLDHNEREFLQVKGLLDEEFIKPLYLN